MTDQTTPADRLRAAATLLREIVTNKLNSDPREWDDDFPAGNVYGNSSTCTSVVIHPGIALALADWLEEAWLDSDFTDIDPERSPALAVADALLNPTEGRRTK